MVAGQEEVVVAVTDKNNSRLGQAILAAALTMPCMEGAIAETVPEFGTISYKYLDYRENQLGEDRIGVKARAWSIMMPFAGEWSVQATYTRDAVSGASPTIWTKSMSSMRDNREAKDVSVTRYFSHDTITFGANLSDENDYRSEGYSISGTHSTEDKNTTFNYGFAVTNDDITSNGVDKTKRKVDWALGVTQVLTPKDIVQFTVTDVNGKGYFSDPWKDQDVRPGNRHQNTAMLRWNHYVDATDGTLRLSYRYYTDSWSIKAHTFGAEYVQPLWDGWVLTPSLRVHDQGAAYFYMPDTISPSLTAIQSYDQRLSAFGARTYGIKISKTFEANWTVDLKYEQYMQRSDWRLFGSGSPGIDPFTAKMLQFGVSYRF